MSKRRRIVFMGTSVFAVPVLERLLAEHDVLLVITQPDRKAGRKQFLTAPPVKRRALELELPIYQPETMKSVEALEKVRQLAPDLCVVVAYGQLLKKELLEIPKEGTLNVHASLLPKYRGASPIQSAILQGEKETGVSIMFLDEGLDTGPVIKQASIPIKKDDDYLSLEAKLSLLGAQTLAEVLNQASLTGIPQDDSKASLCQTISKEHGLLEFKLASAVELERKIRAFAAWPQTFCFWNAKRIKILKASTSNETGEPGRVTVENGVLKIACLQGSLLPQVLQAEGKRAMDAASLLRGYPNFKDSLL
ncbi:MAG: methionyl-tRNA formyltransferase [Candidatus Gracilibacteria bacterium]|nr:methionyl-tRNA formyltransferase [Candidatus Gracilibacteria bacterium]